MALIKCSECGQMISDKATECPNCGCPTKSESTLQLSKGRYEVTYDEDEPSSNKWPYIVIAVLTATIIGLGLWAWQSVMIGGQKKQETEQVDSTTLAGSAATTEEIGSDNLYRFQGKVGKYGAEMLMKVEGELGYGSLHYNSQEKDVNVTLKGDVHPDGSMSLCEYDESGILCGIYEGIFDGKQFEGIFRSEVNGNTMPFSFSIVSSLNSLSESDIVDVANIEENVIERENIEENEYDSYNENEEYYSTDSGSSSAPQWVQGTWKHDVTAPMVGLVASYTLVISGNTMTFYRNGEIQYRDNFTYQKGRLEGQHGTFIVNESTQRISDETGRYDKVGGSGSSSSGNTRFSTAYDVIGYLSGRTFREIESGGSLQIRQDGCYVNGRCMTGAPRVSSFNSTNAVVQASFIPSGTVTFYVDAQRNTITDSNGFNYQ